MKPSFCLKKSHYLWHFFLILVMIAPSYDLFAQFSLTGTISDTDNKALTDCNALLLAKNDSSLVKGTTAGKSGKYVLSDISAGEYLLTFSFTGYETRFLAVSVSANGSAMQEIEPVTLIPVATKLDEVTVVSKKPLFEQKIDRMVINVKNSITSAGSSVLDVLQKSPGVMVNKQAGTIDMNGKNGVQVMINGKLSYMPASALVNLLSGMTANNVERIELITTPPAKYDAGGNAGYINIILLESPDQGFNGSYSLTAGAFYGSSPAANFDFNYRTKKANMYGGYSFTRQAQVVPFSNYRNVKYQGKITESNLKSIRDAAQMNNNIRVGFDYQLGKRTTLGLLVSGYLNRWTMDADNNSSSRINNRPDTSIVIVNKEKNIWKNGAGNINLQHITLKQAEINVNADYLYYDNKNPNQYRNNYLSPEGQSLGSKNATSGKHTIIQILPVQLDYRKKITAKTELEMGAKVVFSRFTNDVLVQNQIKNVWISDPEFSADYLLKENIAAAYASANIVASATNTFKTGLRYEYTYSNLGTETRKDIVNRKYGRIFPTVYWAHKINEKNAINLSYNRRINRPTFNNLAPFLIFMDPNTFLSGNAALQPSISDALKVDYLWKRMSFSSSYTYDNNTIANFQNRIDASTNKQYLIAQNLNRTQSVNATVSIPMAPAKWWFAQLNLVGIWQQVDADYLDAPVTVRQLNYSFSGFQSFTLPKQYSAELSGFFQSPGLFGIAKVRSFGLLNLAFQKKFPKSSSALKLGVDDLFSSMVFRVESGSPADELYTSGRLQFSKRFFKLTFSQNFGNKILKDKRARGTASDAERARVQ
jgi:hypothetical protein